MSGQTSQTDSAWLGAVPWGGHQPAGPAYVAGGKVLRSPSPPPAPAPPAAGWTSPAPAPYVGQQRPVLGILGLTILGLGIFGGAGALIGYLVSGTQKGALVGAVLGLTTPQVASSLLAMRGEPEPGGYTP